ncbi:MAG: hypothetical protein L3J21_03710 [Devosiaceae bacterium]|nr:hypothetical protein [Devosiaceae bacterium]
MANYQELLSKAVGALPESNGASRREVYEKARKALVTQLRAISPPLPAREITQHRLELEDCIRQVEHEATEALLSGLKDVEETSIPLAPAEPDVEQPVVEEPVVEEPVVDHPVAEEVATSEPEADDQSSNGEDEVPVNEASAHEETPKTVTEELPKDSGDELSAALNQASMNSGATQDAENITATGSGDVKEKNGEVKLQSGERQPDTKTSGGQSKSVGNAALDAIIARAEQAKSSSAGFGQEKSNQAAGAASSVVTASNSALADPEVNPSNVQSANSAVSQSDIGVGAAMSQVREVESGPAKVEPAPAIARVDAPDPAVIRSTSVMNDDSQLVVDRAIETLDREARGEPGFDDDLGFDDDNFSNNDGNAGDEFSFGDDEEKGGNGLTIFLVLVILLLGAVGGGAYYAWREGYIDLEALFASDVAVEGQQGDNGAGSAPDAGNTNPVRVIDNGSQNPGAGSNPNVGNTATEVDTNDVSDANVAFEDVNKTEDRLSSNPDGGAAANANDRATQPEIGGDKVEDRLGAGTEAPDTALAQEGDANGAVVGSAQSLLLEASTDGASGAVPFSGTVQWRRGVDELGEPTIIGEANIPAKNLGVRILIRRNGDRSLPASHLMEIDFEVSSAFSGGSIAGLPGILLKNEELVQGAALVGASARVVGNSFLFALSAADADIRTNLDLLQNRKWMDLAMIYSSGRRAIITLEKDEAAQTLFNDVMAIWASAEAAAAANNG